MNYYEILKVSKKATEAEIKSSYKKLVKKYHPDLYQGDKDFAEHKIKEINEAYDVLSNPEKKAEYDEYLNPKPQNTQVQNQSTSSNYYSKTVQQNSRPAQPQWSFFGFIEKKLNKLEKNKQFQFIIIIFFVALLLFLINVIQTYIYLKDEPKKVVAPPNTNTIENNLYYNYNDPQTFDDLFMQYFIESQKNYYENYYNQNPYYKNP